MSKITFWPALLAGVVVAALATEPVSAQKKYDPGASDSEIKIGQTMPYSGPASSYGTIGLAMAAYFEKVNAEGGVNGRKITLLSRDDGFQSSKTVEMTRMLVEQDEVLFMAASLGTAPNIAVQKYLNGKKVPQLFVATGATRWSDPANFPWTMGWQPSYQIEGAILGRYTVSAHPAAKIGILYQNDNSGKDYLKGFKVGLGDAAKQIVAEISYELSDPTVDSQIVALKTAGADTFFLHANPRFSAQAIRRAYELNWRPTMIMASVGASVGAALAPAGLEKSVGAVTAAYMKDAADKVWENDKGMVEWAAFMKQWYARGSLNDGSNLYGYSLAQTVVAVLRQCGDNLTRENVMKQAASLKNLELPLLLPGVRLNTSPEDFLPIKDMRLVRFDGTSWVLMETKALMSAPERVALEGDYDAVVVGAGFGGLYALHRLRELGLSVIGFEAAPEVGGTWYWNRYPGVRCDVPSLYYSYTWSADLRREWRWSEKYATQREILDYARYVAERFELRDLIRFETRVTAAAFDEAEAVWQVTTDRGDRIRARFCVMASGCLSVPNSPKVPGLESFRGPIYHTARWPEQPVDFSGLRVGVIGTGSSGVQAIPPIAEAAAQTVVFQRTPNFSVPARNRPLHDADYEQFEAAYPAYLESLESPNFGRVNAAAFEAPIPSREEQWGRYAELWREGGGGFLLSFPNLLTHEAVNDVACDFVREKISQIVKDPKTAAALSPAGYPLGVKRICVDTNYYETFNRENVELVNLKQEPLDRITADGVATSARQFELDALVFATGFDAITGALFAIDIRGRNELALREAWKDGPRAYLGLTVADFPNLFIITGPGSPSVIGNMINACEQHVDWLADCIDYMRRRGSRILEADPGAERAWMTHVAEMAERTLFPKANSWYLGANIAGKPRVFMPYVGEGYRFKCAQIAARGYEGFRLT